MLVAIKLYLKHVLKLGVKGNYQIFPVESRGIDFVGYVFRHDYIRVRKGIKNSCRKRIRHSNNLAGILPSYFGWFQHCNAVNLKRTILDEVRACKYLNVSRATFDNYVRSGKLPRGEHEAGFKELSWNKKTLDEFIRRSKHEK